MAVTSDQKKHTPRSGQAPGLRHDGVRSSSHTPRLGSHHEDDDDHLHHHDNDFDEKDMIMSTWSSEKQPLFDEHMNSSSILANSTKRSAKDDVRLDLDNLLPAMGINVKGGNAKHQVIPSVHQSFHSHPIKSHPIIT